MTFRPIIHGVVSSGPPSKHGHAVYIASIQAYFGEKKEYGHHQKESPGASLSLNSHAARQNASSYGVPSVRGSHWP